MKIKHHLMCIFCITNIFLYLPDIWPVKKSNKIPFPVIIPQMDGTEKTINLMMNPTWNITQYMDFTAKCDIEIQAPNNTVLITFHLAYPPTSNTKKLSKLLELIRLNRDKIISGALEKEIKIYKILSSTTPYQTMGYYFTATSDYQSNSKFNNDLHMWPILTSILYNLDDTFAHISIFSTSKQQSLFKEIISIFPSHPPGR